MCSGSDYVTFRFVLERRHEYERLINDLLGIDKRQCTLKNVLILYFNIICLF
jgi:hypothetical protein